MNIEENSIDRLSLMGMRLSAQLHRATARADADAGRHRDAVAHMGMADTLDGLVDQAGVEAAERRQLVKYSPVVVAFR